MNFGNLCKDYQIQICPPGHKHYRSGWINVVCPFCSGSFGYHLGFNIEEEYFYCWRCGWHDKVSTISNLLQISKKESKKVILEYDKVFSLPSLTKIQEERNGFKLPSNIVPITPNSLYYRYLQKRNYDPDSIVKTWTLSALGPSSYLDEIDYKYRILIPIFWDGEMVSFTSRDVTGKQIRYKSCPKKYETINHKNIIYKHPSFKEKEGICVEGPFDVWRFGVLAFCTFGIEYTYAQVKLISQLYKKVLVVFDEEEQAIRKGKQLVSELQFRGVKASQITIKGDPSTLSEREVMNIISCL